MKLSKLLNSDRENGTENATSLEDDVLVTY